MDRSFSGSLCNSNTRSRNAGGPGRGKATNSTDRGNLHSPTAARSIATLGSKLGIPSTRDTGGPDACGLDHDDCRAPPACKCACH
eukprot:8528414-Alexandrium_andersonii.AAC.1